MLDFLALSYQQAQTDLFLLDTLKKADYSSGFRLEHSLHYETAAIIAPVRWRQECNPTLNDAKPYLLTDKTHPVDTCLSDNANLSEDHILYCYPGIPCDKCCQRIAANARIKSVICFECSEHVYGINDKQVYDKSLSKLLKNTGIQVVQYPYPYNSENGIQLIDNFDRIYK